MTGVQTCALPIYHEDPDEDEGDSNEPDGDDPDEPDDDENGEPERFIIDDKEYSAKEIYSKYLTFLSESNNKYNELEKQYSELKLKYKNLEKDFKTCNEKLRYFETRELICKVKEVLAKTDFTDEEKKEFLKRCENKEFNSIQEATKEIA